MKKHYFCINERGSRILQSYIHSCIYQKYYVFEWQRGYIHKYITYHVCENRKTCILYTSPFLASFLIYNTEVLIIFSATIGEIPMMHSSIMTVSPAFYNAQQHDDRFPAFPIVMDNQTYSMNIGHIYTCTHSR